MTPAYFTLPLFPTRTTPAFWWRRRARFWRVGRSCPSGPAASLRDDLRGLFADGAQVLHLDTGLPQALASCPAPLAADNVAASRVIAGHVLACRFRRNVDGYKRKSLLFFVFTSLPN
ncbi:MAG: hypothetical protein ACLU1W_04895 [Collinsella sp.]